MLSATSPFSFILFGASGHLAKLKIYPALYILAMKGRFPKEYNIVGYARTPMTDEAFRELVTESIKKDLQEVNPRLLTEFLTHVHYHQGQYDSSDDFQALETRLQGLEEGWKDGVRLAYLSIPPTVFKAVLENVCQAGVRKKGSAFRCIVEKPVGHDLKTFEDVRATLMHCFEEEEIYLLDHYLGKEAVRNVYYLRYANPVLERLFKNTLIQHVEVVADEAAGIEERAGYFDATGTLRDMFQSHLLELCALLTMRLEAHAPLPAIRLAAMQELYLPPATSLDDVVLQGQYAAGSTNGKALAGYAEEKDVAPGSRTSTAIALKLLTRAAQWQGVPFYLRSGKRLEKKETRISIRFQQPHPVGEGCTNNRLDIILQGEAGMRLHLQTKLGGSVAFRPLLLTDPLVCVGDCLPEHAVLLLEAIHGKKEWFLTFDEIRTSWRFIDPLQAHLDKSDTPLALYPAGSKVPKEMEGWMQKDGLAWME